MSDDTVTFENADKRHKLIVLDWPVTHAGKRYEMITLRRLTVAEVAAFVAKVAAQETVSAVRFPMFFDDEGAPVPDAVMDGLDADDADALAEAALDFLPRRFRGATTEPVSVPASGGTTAPSSAT